MLVCNRYVKSLPICMYVYCSCSCSNIQSNCRCYEKLLKQNISAEHEEAKQEEKISHHDCAIRIDSGKSGNDCKADTDPFRTKHTTNVNMKDC